MNRRKLVQALGLGFLLPVKSVVGESSKMVLPSELLEPARKILAEKINWKDYIVVDDDGDPSMNSAFMKRVFYLLNVDEDYYFITTDYIDHPDFDGKMRFYRVQFTFEGCREAIRRGVSLEKAIKECGSTFNIDEIIKLLKIAKVI